MSDQKLSLDEKLGIACLTTPYSTPTCVGCKFMNASIIIVPCQKCMRRICRRCYTDCYICEHCRLFRKIKIN
jgi:hypothetical protein